MDSVSSISPTKVQLVVSQVLPTMPELAFTGLSAMVNAEAEVSEKT